jgi:hypothetical protein
MEKGFKKLAKTDASFSQSYEDWSFFGPVGSAKNRRFDQLGLAHCSRGFRIYA